MDTLARRQIFLDNFMGFPIRYGGWAISEDILFDMLQFCLLKEPKVILDLGTGATTLVLAKYAEQMKKRGVAVKIISVDSDAEWLSDTKELMKKNSLENFIDLIHAPIVETKFGLYYETEMIIKSLQKEKIDLMTIDGPPGITTKEARYPAMAFFEKYMKEDGVVFLDDGRREEEKNIIVRWNKDFPVWKSEYRDYMKGAFVLYKENSGVERFLIQNHLGKIFENEVAEKDRLIEERNQLIQTKDQKILEGTRLIQQKEIELRDKNQIIQQKDQKIKEKNQLIQAKDQKISEDTQLIWQKERQLEELSFAKEKLENSKSFQIGSLFFRSLKNPIKWLTFPVNFFKIIFS